MEEFSPLQHIRLDQLNEEYRARYGAAIALLKEEVGEGDLYENVVARAMITPNGAWYECADLAAEFSGISGGPVSYRFLTEREALTLLQNLDRLSREIDHHNSRHFDLLALYTRAGIVDGRGVYLYRHLPSPEASVRPPRSLGKFRPDQLPLFYRCRLDTTLTVEGVNLQRGVVFGLALPGDKNLYVEMAYEGESLQNLGAMPQTPLEQ